MVLFTKGILGMEVAFIQSPLGSTPASFAGTESAQGVPRRSHGGVVPGVFGVSSSAASKRHKNLIKSGSDSARTRGLSLLLVVFVVLAPFSPQPAPLWLPRVPALARP